MQQRRFIDGYNIESGEAVIYKEEVTKQFEYFYQYVHGERMEPDGAE